MKKDDLTVGPMALHFRRLAIPAALGMLFATLYNVVDVYFAGRLSTDAQAGLAIGYQAFFILMALGFGLSSALSALVSNAKGSGETSLVRKYISQGLIYAVILTLLSIIIGLFIGPKLIGLVSEPGSYRNAGLGYFGWLIFALPGFLIAYADWRLAFIVPSLICLCFGVSQIFAFIELEDNNLNENLQKNKKENYYNIFKIHF